jgi:plastocyanin
MIPGPKNIICTLRELGAGIAVWAFVGTVQAAEIEILVTDQAGNRLQDAAVVADALASSADAASRGEAKLPLVIIAQHNKQFEPYVSVIRVGTAIDFPNRDHILHNVYSFSKVKLFQLPLYKDKPPQPVLFDKPGVVVLGCNIHDWMVAYVYVVASPYFSKTDAGGRAVLAALPPGAYRIRAWHPRKKRRGSSQPREIRITETSDPVRMEFTIGLKPEWRPNRPARQN